MSTGAFAAIDLGASSGRVMLGEVAPDRLRLDEVHRFPNEPVALPDGLHWDLLSIYREVVTGLRRAAEGTDRLVSLGIDSWAVDYGLLDANGELLGNPFHYRDQRNQAGVRRVHAIVPPERLYARNGLQFLPFNTLYQLAAGQEHESFSAARTMLLIPDLVGYWLTGEAAAEATNASTTGLLDPREHTWAWDLIDELAFPRGLFPVLRSPGETLGPIRTDVAAAAGLPNQPVVTLVGSHDTASAVVGVPAVDDEFAYISCGTWSLVGVELDAPRLDQASRAANFTNEGGVDGRVRYLRNVMGLWLLQESMRTWSRGRTPEDLERILEAAAEVPAGGPVIDPDDPVFLPPGDMPTRIEEACVRAGQPPPSSRPALVRCILDSLAGAYARAVRDAARLTGRSVKVIHIVGGGSYNALLCQLTSNACELPVVAGPAEATALGNLLVQARAHGRVSGDLEDLRALIRTTSRLRRFEPALRAVVGGG